MNIDTLLQDAQKKGLRALPEDRSKQILKAFNIPVVMERTAENENQAVAAATEFGFPVVIKGVGAKLLHKTERGLVRLGIQTEADLRKAAKAIAAAAGDELEGLLVQPQIRGGREMVAGLFRDPQFGPVVMFGLGGVFTEALQDVSLRIAPLSRADALEMIDEIKARRLLEAFRGEAAADLEMLVKTLMGLSEIGVRYPQIAEIDINPLIITPQGDVLAVDALVVPGAAQAAQSAYLPVDPHLLGRLFYPRSIAFVGASSQMGKWGHMLFTITASGGFEGEIYLVNPKGGEIAGRQVYPSVMDIPGKVDLAVVTVPARRVMDLIPQFKAKKIQFVLLISSGFAEIGDSGKDLEQELVRQMREAGIIFIGPNTMGICNPHIHLYCTGSHVRPRAGSTAVVAQSGNMGTQLLAFAEQQGIGIRGFCGSGNEAMITIEDFMEGFEQDDLTHTVMLYVESVKDGRRFFESARRVGRKKPIVLLKGGQSRAGNQAAASHTGAMTSDTRVFDAVCRQAGIVKVNQPMDLLDLAAAFSSLPLPKGNRAAIMTLGGGWGVVTADLCEQYGLAIPPLSDDIIARIDKILPPYWSRANPVDLVGENDNTIPMVVIEELLAWQGCDAVINLGIMGRRILAQRLADSVLAADPTYSPDFIDYVNQALIDFEEQYVRHIVALMEKYQKPVFGVSLMSEGKDQSVYRVEGTPYKGLFFQTPERAAKAFAKMHDYYRFLNRG